MNYLEHIFALATFTLPVFLQVMATLAILSVWRPLGKPKLLSGRSIFIVNLDQAIRNNESGSLEQMEEVANAIAKSNDGVERLIYFYGDLEGDLRVNESLARWSEKDPRHGPIVNMSDEEQRWANELVYEKWSLGIREGASPPDTEKQDRFPFERNRINELIKELAEQYFYRPSSKWHNKAIDRSSQVMVDQDIDGHAYICNVVDRVCVNDQQKTQVLQSLNFGAIKTLNIYQVQSEYHESIRNLHVKIRSDGCGGISVAQEIASAQGFEIKYSSFSYAHLVLGELPPTSSRYLIVETGGRRLPEKNISLEYDLLSKLGPESLKLYSLIAFNIAMYSFIAKTLFI